MNLIPALGYRDFPGPIELEEIRRHEAIRSARMLFDELSKPIFRHLFMLDMMGRRGLVIHQDGRIDLFIHKPPAVMEMEVDAHRLLDQIQRKCFESCGVKP